MMPVGAGGGGFLRGRLAKPPSSRGSRPSGPARARRAGRAGKEVAWRARPAPAPPGRAGGAAPAVSEGWAGVRGSVVRGSLRGPGAGAGVVGGPGAGPGGGPRAGAPSLGRGAALPAEPPRPHCPGGEAGGEIGAGRFSPCVPAGFGRGGRGVVWRSPRFGVSRRLCPPPEMGWCRIWCRQCGHPRVVFPRWKPTFLRSPFLILESCCIIFRNLLYIPYLGMDLESRFRNSLSPCLRDLYILR